MRWWLILLMGCSETLLTPIGQRAQAPHLGDSPLDGIAKEEPFDMHVETCEAARIETVDQIRPVDILWAIDTSPSMAGEKKIVRDRLNDFSNQLDAKGIDAHVVLIASQSSDGGICIAPPLGSGSCPNDHNPPLLFRDYQWVGSHNALNRFVWEWDQYKSAIRENSVKYYAVVTDDNAEWSASEFTNARNALDPKGADRWTFFGMFCKYLDRGDVYQDLVDQTGGMHVELCIGKPSWTDVFTEMEQTVMENRSLDCELDIPEAPLGYAFDAEKINVDYIPGDGRSEERFYRVNTAADCGAGGGWYYDDPANPTRINLCEASCDTVDGDFDGTLEVWFGCTSETHP